MSDAATILGVLKNVGNAELTMDGDASDISLVAFMNA